METASRPTNFVSGTNDPSPVTHVIGFDYYDGLISGVLRTGDGSSYRFDMVGEEPNPDGLDRRTFELCPLPEGAFDRLVAALERDLTPNWPCWVPCWVFPTEAARRAADDEVECALARKGEPTWQVSGSILTDALHATPLS